MLDVYRYCVKIILRGFFSLGPMVGHVGDGNFHVFFPVDQSNPDEVKTVHDVSVKMAL